MSSNGLPQLRVTFSSPDATGAPTVLHVDGPLTARTAGTLRDPLRELNDRRMPRRLVVDLSDVTRVDPAGLGVLVGALRRVQLAGDGRELVLVDHGGAVRTKARLTGLARLLGFSPAHTATDKASAA